MKVHSMNSPAKPVHLKCEYLINPIGLDCARPRLFWQLQDSRPSARQQAYQILCSSSRDKINLEEGDLWDSGRTESSDTTHIAYGGAGLKSAQLCFWKVRIWDHEGQVSNWSEVQTWETGLLNADEWQADWISMDGMDSEDPLVPVAYFRKSFTLGSAPQKVRIYITAKGVYTLFINGKRVSNDLFTPGWTDYRKRLPYQTYDVTDFLGKGENVIGVILANGWYSGYLAWTKQAYGKFPQLKAQLVLVNDDKNQVIATDDTWNVSTGPILFSDIYMGEAFDACLSKEGWSEPGFNDSAWRRCKTHGTKDSVPLVGVIAPPVRAICKLHPVSISEPVKGTYVFDLGQNMVGYAKLKVKGKAGVKVTLRYGEMLNPDGTLYTVNLRKARCVDEYITRGGNEEVYEPNFTFHGFRYVEVTGFPGTPTIEAITGIVLHTDLCETGFFECSDPLVTRLHRNIVWGQKGNFLELPTDCPQRDERLGWTGDAQVFIRTSCFNMEVAPFFSKWLVALDDGQQPNGAYPDVAPYFDITGSGTAAWGDAGVICPWVIYEAYGDLRILEDHYPAMQKWIEYLKQSSTDFIRPDSGYGDWLSIAVETPRDLIGTAYFAYVTRLMSRISSILGKQKEHREYEILFDQIKEAFNREFVTRTGRIVGDTQTAYLLALHFDLLPEEGRKAAGHHLVADIERKEWHLSTGFVGVSYLLPVLESIGRLDVAHKLLLQKSYPSWLFPVSLGATTMWERWNSWTPDRGFEDYRMNSFNHYAYGSVGEWIYSHVGGIELDDVGFRRIRIHPKPCEKITWAKARYDSIQGTIQTWWKVEENVFWLKIVIPANTSAVVYLPVSLRERVTEGSKPLDSNKAITSIRTSKNSLVCEVNAGQFEFKCYLDGSSIITHTL